jgi:hypothetical protein
MSELSSDERNWLLVPSVPEAALLSLSNARVPALVSVPTPVEAGLTEISPVTATAAMDIASVSIPVEIGITDASHAACSIKAGESNGSLDLLEVSLTLAGSA